jgi:hypothetical protein
VDRDRAKALRTSAANLALAREGFGQIRTKKLRDSARIRHDAHLLRSRLPRNLPRYLWRDCRKFAKSLAWVHGPFVAHDRFVVQYDMDVTDTGSKKRMQLSEIGVYAVKDGKIVREEFLPSTGQS